VTRSCAAVALVVTVVLIGSPRSADAEVPAGSTRSEISAVIPGAPAPTVTIVGGDEYVRLTAPGDHEVIVAGYSDEPYLRFRADGTVDQNDRSPAVALNNDRYGTADVSSYDTHAAPVWSSVGGGGTYQWHDHRIHSMAITPLTPAPDGTVFYWTIPIIVDGTTGEIRGSLVQESTGSGWLSLAGVIALVIGLVVAGRHRALVTARVAAVVAAGAAALAMVGERVAVGGLLVGGVAPLIPVALALAAAVVVGVARKPSHQLMATVAVPIVLSGWLLTRAVVLWGPVVVSWWAPAVQRGLVVVAAGFAIATGVLALEVWRRQLSRPKVSRRAA
jgi:hypothetical protein